MNDLFVWGCELIVTLEVPWRPARSGIRLTISFSSSSFSLWPRHCPNIPNGLLPKRPGLCMSSCLELFSGLPLDPDLGLEITSQEKSDLTASLWLFPSISYYHIMFFHCHLSLLDVTLWFYFLFVHYLFSSLECQVHVSSGFVPLCAPRA